MTRRTATGSVAQRLADAVTSSGVTTASVAAATDMDPRDLEARLRGDADFTYPEAVHVGGFLRFTAAELFRGATA
jgi:hypothetical protein